jgi:hypothetical protein
MRGVDRAERRDRTERWLESISESLAIYQSDGNIPAGNLTLSWIKDDVRREALTYLPEYK